MNMHVNPMATGAPPEPVDVYVGAQIRIARRASGLSQSGLAEAAGVSFQQVQKYERGDNRVSASRLVMIAKALGVPTASLLPPDGEEQDIDGVCLAVLNRRPGGPDMLERLCHLPDSAFRAVGAIVEHLHALTPES